MIPICKPKITDEEISAVTKVLRSGNIVQGEETSLFEKEFSEYVGTDYGIITSSGTTALMVGLTALGLKKGDEVITTPFSFIASSNSIIYTGAKPVFVDINPKTFNIEPSQIKEKITERTKALLIVHLYGLPCDMDPILDICKEHNLLLIEDCCQAHGAEYKNKKVGTFGDLSVFSFYATKNMICGEGGIILTNNQEVAERCKALRSHGEFKRYNSDFLGYNFRGTDIFSAIGRIQLKKLKNFNERRREIARMYNQELKDVGDLELPLEKEGYVHVYHQYTIKTSKRDELLEFLLKEGIGNKIYYPVPIYKQEPYKSMGYDEALPAVENVSSEVLSIPVHPSVTDEDVMHIISSIKKFFGENNGN